MRRADLGVNRYYSNGAYGRSWGVRLITGFAIDPDSGAEMVTYKGVAGQCRRKTGQCARDTFSAWARYEVALNENSWQRIGGESDPDG